MCTIRLKSYLHTISLLIMGISFTCQASEPIFSITPNTPNQISISSYSNTSVIYTVVNNTPNQRTLAMEPLSGVSQNTSVSQSCNSPFVLSANGGSCYLVLNIIGSLLPSNSVGGPKICKTVSDYDNSLSPFLCAKPNPISSLATRLSSPYSYIGNAGDDTVSQCSINTTTGLFENCANTGIPVVLNQVPEDIVFVAGGTIAYVVYSDDSGGTNGVIKACVYNNQNGNLSSCYNTSTGPLSRPQTVTLNALETIAYITESPNDGSSGSVLQCQVDRESYNLSNCVNTSIPNIHRPQDLAMNSANTFAYIANGAGSSIDVTQCGINATTGALTSCIDSGANLEPMCAGTANEAIVFNANQTMTYITCTNNLVMKCNVNANTGALSGCVDSGASDIDYPIGLALNSANTLAYITNYNSNSVTKCDINAVNGNLMNCQNAQATGITLPTGIAFH